MCLCKLCCIVLCHPIGIDVLRCHITLRYIYSHHYNRYRADTRSNANIWRQNQIAVFLSVSVFFWMKWTNMMSIVIEWNKKPKSFYTFKCLQVTRFSNYNSAPIRCADTQTWTPRIRNEKYKNNKNRKQIELRNKTKWEKKFRHHILKCSIHQRTLMMIVCWCWWLRWWWSHIYRQMHSAHGARISSAHVQFNVRREPGHIGCSLHAIRRMYDVLLLVDCVCCGCCYVYDVYVCVYNKCMRMLCGPAIHSTSRTISSANCIFKSNNKRCPFVIYHCVAVKSQINAKTCTHMCCRCHCLPSHVTSTCAMRAQQRCSKLNAHLLISVRLNCPRSVWNRDRPSRFLYCVLLCVVWMDLR